MGLQQGDDAFIPFKPKGANLPLCSLPPPFSNVFNAQDWCAVPAQNWWGVPATACFLPGLFALITLATLAAFSLSLLAFTPRPVLDSFGAGAASILSPNSSTSMSMSMRDGAGPRGLRPRPPSPAIGAPGVHHDAPSWFSRLWFQSGHACSPLDHTAPDALRTKAGRGVVCTLVKDEKRNLPEWVEFHLMLGFAKVVIYDDNSSESVRDVLSPWGSRVDVHDIYDISNDTADQPWHRQSRRQNAALNDCKNRYSNGPYRWLAIFDVDEFVFPCFAPSARVPLEDALGLEVDHLPKGDNHIHLDCAFFGPNDADRPLEEGELVTKEYTRRAPSTSLEPVLQKLIRQHLSGCENGDDSACEWKGFLPKSMYILDVASPIHPQAGAAPPSEPLFDVHYPLHPEDWRTAQGSGDRRRGICCNHYKYKSSAEWRAKALRNRNSPMLAQSKNQDAHEYFRMISDMQVWQYLPRLTQGLALRGWNVSEPVFPSTP